MKTFRRYRFYSFVGQDPIVGTVKLVMGNHSRAHVSRQSGVSTSTLGKWMNKKTKRPQFATVAAVINSMNHELKVVRKKGRV